MINNVVLVGRLTKKPDLKFTTTGTKYTQFSVAVQKKFKNQNGEYESDFINCLMWSTAAENFSLLESKKVTESRNNAVQPIEESPFNGVSDDDLPF